VLVSVIRAQISKSILTYFLKVRGDDQSVTNSGKLFRARGPVMTDEQRVAGNAYNNSHVDQDHI